MKRIVTDSVLVGIVSEADPKSGDNVTTTLRSLQAIAKESSRRHRSSVSVQYVIYVPSTLVKPGFKGVKLGTYLRSQNQLNILIALPDDDTDFRNFLSESLDEGPALVCPWSV